jgi:hypothetical protein
MDTYSKQFKCPNALCAVFLIILPLLSATPSGAATPSPKKPKASCRIEIDNAHISTSLLKNLKVKYVKVNARSICNVPQQRVTLTVEIYKIGVFGNHFVDSHFTNPSDHRSSGFRVENQNTKALCISSQVTNYFGIAYAKAFIQGKWQYAGRTQSTKVVPLRCGTSTK